MDANDEGEGGNEAQASSCEKISIDTYEKQKVVGYTSGALRELVKQIDGLEDQNMRKEMLEKVKIQYPHLYKEFEQGLISKDNPK